MRDHATPAQIQHYREQGFVVVEDLLTPAEVAELRAGVDDAVARMGGDIVEGADPVTGRKEGQSYYQRVFLQKINLWKISAPVKRVLAGPEVGGIASALAGCDLRLWHDQTLQKPPWANPTAFHMDNPYHSFHSPQEISIWIALDDATLQNGCMHFLPGSHKLATYDNSGIGADFGQIFDIYPGMASIEAKPVPMRAGSCSFHSGLTVHGAGPNISPRWRRAMTCIYMPAGATYNGIGNILSAERQAALKIGDCLDDDVEHPLVTPRVAVGAGR